MADFERLKDRDAQGVRALLGDGNYGGYYQRSDAEMQALWAVGVAETRAQLEGDWA
jgi:creatinine amidohydrolase